MHIRFALIAAVFTCGQGQGKGMEPEPDVFSTSMEPEPDSMMMTSSSMMTSTASMTTTTGTTGGSNMTTAANVTVPEHAITMTITLTNISAVADEATLLQQIRAGLLSAAGGGSAEVTEVVIAFINVVSVYKNLPQIVVDAIITAYVAMTVVARASVTVNGQLHSGDNSTRRLQSDATVKAKITKQSGVDVVQASQTLTQSVSLASMITQLEMTSDYAAGSLSGMTMDPITTELSVTSKVKGTATAPTAADIESNVGSAIVGAGATVSGVSVASTGVASTTTPSSMEDNAPVASLLIAWAAVCYAFVMA